MNDLFNWGNDKFVLGRQQLADASGNSTVKRKKTPQEIFMEAILEGDEEKPKQEETPKAEDEKPNEEESEKSVDTEEEKVLDRDDL